MATAIHIKAKIIPWDDPVFVRAFELARDAVDCGPTPYAACGPEVERRLRSAGYPHCTVTVEHTVQEAMAHSARWEVRRDG